MKSQLGLLGKKLGMAQVFDEEGRQVPVTVVEVGPCYVTALRTQDKNGYSAVQIAFDPAKEKRVNRPRLGQFKAAKVPALRLVREIRTNDLEGLEVGQKLTVENFEVGDFVDVEGTSIGHGFQGVVKRHHFKGAQTFSHGDMSRRRPGSIGASSFPSRVVKGMKMHGQMGNTHITVQNLKIVKIDQENNLLVVKGSVPGTEGGYLMVKTALKRGASRKWKGPKAASKAEAPAKEAAEAKPEAAAE